MPDTAENNSSLSKYILNERFLCGYIITLIIALPVIELIAELFGAAYIYQPLVVTAAGLVGFVIACSYFLTNLKRGFYPTDIIYLLLLLFAGLSIIFSRNIEHTLYGGTYGEKPACFLAYFSLMLSATMISESKYKKKILAAFVIMAVIQASVATLQTCGIAIPDRNIIPAQYQEFRVSYGLIANTNWYGGLSVIMFTCLSGIFLFTERPKVRNTAFVISMVSFYTLLSSESRLAWVGVFAYLVFLVISIAVMSKSGFDKQKLSSIKKRFFILLAGMVVVTLFAMLACGKIIGRLHRIMDELGGSVGGFGSGRLAIWMKGFEALPQCWLFGLGMDNFVEAFKLGGEANPAVIQFRAHNEYLHYLFTQGILQLAVYVTLLVYTAVNAVKTVKNTSNNEERFICWIFLGMFIGYIAQAFFNSSIISVVPYFWITIGMCIPQKNQRLIKKRDKATTPQS